MWPARQCLTGQNALDSLDSKKVTRQKRLGIMAMAGGPARPDYIGVADSSILRHLPLCIT